MNELIERIARVCHETNRAICETAGDHSQKPWEQCQQWQKDSVISGVRFMLDNPEATSKDTHIEWCRHKEKEGWTYGDVKDEVLKKHPCLVPYENLPAVQRLKDVAFKAIVKAHLEILHETKGEL